MEPVKHRLSALIREAVILPQDNADITPSSNRNKAEQERKASTISVQDEGQTKSRKHKHQPSSRRTSEPTSGVLRVAKTSDFQSNDGAHRSTLEELIVEDESESDEIVEDLLQMQLCEEQASEDLQCNESADTEEAQTGYNEEQKRLKLEEKLTQDDTSDVIGVMDLSSMNVTDDDIPRIIQRVFRKKRKKCFGLILRNNALTSEGVKILVDAFLTMKTDLRYLSFADNSKIGDEGIEHLTRLLQKNRTMTFLAVPNTGMTDRGVRMLADTLCGVNTDSPCAPLEKLYISFNESITDESLEAILQIIEQNRTLKVLSLRHCSLSNTARRRLRQAGTKLKKRSSVLRNETSSFS